MSSVTKVSLILPAYNEVRRIADTIKEVKAYFEEHQLLYEVIVVADGNDGTRELVSRLAQDDTTLKVLGSAERCGKGHGIRQGIKIADGEYIGFMDADNKTSIEEFAKILPWLEQGYHVVFGSRGLRQSNIQRTQPWYRRMGSKGFRYFMQTIVGLPNIVDTQCGFKFFQHAIAKDLFSRQQINGYMFDIEILFLARIAGYKLKEVPITWRDDGDSRLDLIAGNITNALDIFRIRFNYFKSQNETTTSPMLVTLDTVENEKFHP